jgi:hypothetical protein
MKIGETGGEISNVELGISNFLVVDALWMVWPARSSPGQTRKSSDIKFKKGRSSLIDE